MAPYFASIFSRGAENVLLFGAIWHKISIIIKEGDAKGAIFNKFSEHQNSTIFNAQLAFSGAKEKQI